MSLAGLGAVCIWHDLLPEARDDFHQWHNREHMPERVGIPGFRRGRRYVAVASTPEYFNLYEADSPEVLGGQDYLNRLNAPTEWTRRVVPSFRNVSRSICRVVYTDGVGQGGFMLTQRFDVAERDRPHVVKALRQRLLPPLCDDKGIAGVHLCLADESISKVETAEKKARADTTQVPTWIMLIEGNSSADVGSGGCSAERAAAALARRAWCRDRDIGVSAGIFALQDGVECRLTFKPRSVNSLTVSLTSADFNSRQHRAAMHPATHITGTTRLYGLVGDPLTTAKSPELLNRLFIEQRANAVCVPFWVKADDLAAFVKGARAMGNLSGVLVTMPHKQRMLGFVDELHPTARQVGALNIVRCDDDGRWVGAMFDGVGCVLGMQWGRESPRQQIRSSRGCGRRRPSHRIRGRVRRCPDAHHIRCRQESC
jgi:hypothetical protein